MSRYRKVLTRIWHDERFRPMEAETQRLFLYHLTSPQSTPFLLYVEGLGQIRDSLKMAKPAFKRATTALSEAGMVMYGEDGSSLVLLPKALKYEENAPTSNTAVISWVNLFNELPATPFRDAALRHWVNLRSQTVLHKGTLTFIETLERLHITPLGKGGGSGLGLPIASPSGSGLAKTEGKALSVAVAVSGAVAVAGTGTEAVAVSGGPPASPGRPETGVVLSHTPGTARGAMRSLHDAVAELKLAGRRT